MAVEAVSEDLRLLTAIAASELFDQLDTRTQQQIEDRLRRAVAERSKVRVRPWALKARNKQLPPDNPKHHLPWTNPDTGITYSCGCKDTDTEFSIHLFLAGRGFGKTVTGANWLVEQAMRNPNSEWAVVAPSFRDVRKTCIESDVGIRAALLPGEEVNYRRNELQVILSNGSVIYGYSAENPDKVRGANLWGAWCDEVASWRYPATWYEGLLPALRKGQHPRVVVTTTPRPTRLINDLTSRNDGSVHITRGSTWENSRNLSAIALAELRRRYEGTRLGRQELEGELLEDVEGALWNRQMLEDSRVGQHEVPSLVRVVVAIDPAQGSEEQNDETGIVVVGEGADGHGYILEDLSGRYTPMQAMRVAVRAYTDHGADSVVAEVNSGGDYVGTALHNVDPDVPYKQVRASRGKAMRAQPVATLYEKGVMHHVGCFPEMEDQMCLWVPESLESPDRLDALVWGVTELRGLGMGDWSAVYGTYTCRKCERAFLLRDRKRCPHCSEPIPEDEWGKEEAPPGRLMTSPTTSPTNPALQSVQASRGSLSHLMRR